MAGSGDSFSDFGMGLTLSLGENATFSATAGRSGSNNSNSTNQTIPIDMMFNDGHIFAICGYSVLFVLSAIGNLSILVIILRSRCRGRSIYTRINFMLLHLAIADLMVTFLMMPLEIAWAITVSWHGGDLLCRVMAFFRIFGLYLSSFVLVCLAIDRYLAVKYPLQVFGCLNRGKKMIILAWCLAFLCSLPQVVIFHEARHPDFSWYTQCVSFGSFATPQHEFIYNVFVMLMMYAFPFAVILLLYCGIVLELFQRTSSSITSTSVANDGLRSSGVGNLGKAKVKTLKMTVVIVVIFFVCWTPYYIMCLWYWIDKESALVVDQKIQKALFLFACTNSTANPVVYGVFHLKQIVRSGPVNRRRLLTRCHSLERTSSVTRQSNRNTAVCLLNMKPNRNDHRICSNCNALKIPVL